MLVSFAHAQSERALLGPLLAVTSAEQDGILLYDIGVMQLGTDAGSPVRRELTFGRGWQQVWDFSPDGCRILFTMNDGGAVGSPARLYSARIDGTDMRELVQYDELAPADWGVWEPDWSPDGANIAFTMIRQNRPGAEVSDATGHEYHLAVIDAEGGTPDFYSVTGDEHEPQWSPDGQWLAYTSYEERVPGADILSTAVPTIEPPPGSPETPLLRESDIWVVSADATSKYRLTQFDVGSARTPRWSPDGFLISFIYAPSPNNDQFWMVANKQGALTTQLSAAASMILDNTWLPDSTALISAVRDFQGTTQNRLWLIPLVGLADTDAQPYPLDASLDYADYPRFSADGRWLALRTAYALALVDVGTDFSYTLLDENLPGNSPPVWSPAGFSGEADCI